MWPGRGHVRDPEYVFQEQVKGIKPMEANNENPIIQLVGLGKHCLLYTSDAADE